MKRRAPGSFALLVLAAILTTGCWNRKEIETLGFAIAAGIDSNERGYLLSTQVANTQGMSKDQTGKSPTYFVFTASGETVFDAIRSTTHVSPKRLFWSHTKILVFGEAMGRKGIKPALEFFGRDAEERRNFLLAVTREQAEDILKADVKTDKVPTLALLEQLELHKATSTNAYTNLNEFIRGMSGTTAQLVPDVRIVKDQGGKEGYHVQGAAVFKGDRLTAHLSPIETRGVLWVLGKVKSAIIVAKCPNTSGQKPEDKLSFEVFKAKSGIKVEKVQDHFAIDVKIEESGNLAEGACTEDEIKPESIKQLEQVKTQKIEAEIQEALHKARLEKADLFGFGEAIHRKYPKEWKALSKKWDEVFPTLDVSVTVKSKVTGNALLQRKGQKVTR